MLPPAATKITPTKKATFGSNAFGGSSGAGAGGSAFGGSSVVDGGFAFGGGSGAGAGKVAASLPPPAATKKKKTPTKKAKPHTLFPEPDDWHGLWPFVGSDQWRTPDNLWDGALELVNWALFKDVYDSFYNDERSQALLQQKGPQWGFVCKGPFEFVDFFEAVDFYGDKTVVISNPP
jgi:hypothetical protein